MTQESPEQQATNEALSRRGMLRYGAFAAAAAAGAAGSAALATPASAAAGDAVAVDGTVTGTAVTKITGSSLDVTGSNASAGNTLPKAAIIGRAAAAAGTGVVGIGAGPTGAGIVALNPGGPQLQIGLTTKLPDPGTVTPGAIINFGGYFYQAVAGDPTEPDAGPVWIALGATPVPIFKLLDKPTRVYASSKDLTHPDPKVPGSGAKIARGETRPVDTTWIPAHGTTPGQASGVPSSAHAVVGTVQLEATEQSSGYLTIGSGNYDNVSGYSTAVWSATNFAGVTAFTSAVGDLAAIPATPTTPAKPATYGKLSVTCQSANAAGKTHFYIDIVGYYVYDILSAPDGAVQAAANAKTLARIGAQHRRALRKH
jgi:hypothetical protein